MFTPNNISHFRCVYYVQHRSPWMWRYWIWNFEKIELLVIAQRWVEMGEISSHFGQHLCLCLPCIHLANW